MKTIGRVGVIFLVILPTLTTASDDLGTEFFEQKIRPVLVEHCYSCHSAGARDSKKIQAALFLDSATGIAAGGESGEVSSRA